MHFIFYMYITFILIFVLLNNANDALLNLGLLPKPID